MKKKYLKWIQNNVENTYGECKNYSEKMLIQFPELKLIRGHYLCGVWGEREHWWLMDEDNNIIDPTAAQFPTKGHCVYRPWDESCEEPIGKCINCGGYVFSGEFGTEMCSKKCADEYMAYLNAPINLIDEW